MRKEFRVYDEVAKEWFTYPHFPAALEHFERQSESHMRAGALPVPEKCCHDQEDYYLDVFDNGAVVEGWMYFFDFV